jgi:hypothetical protein
LPTNQQLVVPNSSQGIKELFWFRYFKLHVFNKSSRFKKLQNIKNVSKKFNPNKLSSKPPVPSNEMP